MNKLSYIMAYICGAIIVSCTKPLLLNEKARLEAEQLKNICMENAIQVDEVIKADSLYASGVSKLKKGKRNDGLYDLDMAGLYYRISIIKNELEQKQKKAAQLEKSLKETQQKVESYRKIILELENMR